MIEKHLANFLGQENSVTIENLGTFSREHISSEIKEGKLVPPATKVHFELSQKNDPQIFKNYVLEQEGISETEYDQHLSEFLDNLQRSLQNEGRYSLRAIGNLVKNNNDLFLEAHETSVAADSFGLPDLEHKPIYSQPIKTEKPVEAEKKKNRELVWWLITVVVVFFGAFFAYLLVQKDALDRLKSFIRPERQVVAIDANNPDQKTTDATSIDSLASQQDSLGGGDLAEDTGEQNSEENSQQNEANTDNTTTPNNENVATTGNYFVIAGSFADKKLADGLKSKLETQGFQATILDTQENKYRVSIAQYSDLATAQQKAKELEGKLGSLWVMKNK